MKQVVAPRPGGDSRADARVWCECPGRRGARRETDVGAPQRSTGVAQPVYQAARPVSSPSLRGDCPVGWDALGMT